MNGIQKQQVGLIGGAILLAGALYFFGPTVSSDKKNAPAPEEAAFDIENFRKGMVSQLSPERQKYLASLESEVKRGDVNTQEHTLLHQLSNFWRDSVPVPPLHYFYISKDAELDNSEKSLTFAAHSILGYIPYESDHDVQHWLAGRGKELFEKALQINATNDSSIVGLGGCIMYGAPSEGGNPMEGILKVRQVADNDSTDIFAQYMLGVGGVISKQYDKASLRFEKVAAAQPENIEVLFKLAEAYELGDNKPMAIKTYQKIEGKMNNPEMKIELKKRIESLQK